MNWLSQLRARRRHGRALREEIAAHLEQKVEELIAAGCSPEEAERTAHRQFGNVLRIAERSREVWRWNWIEDATADVRYAFRQLRRSPGFALVAVLTLAVGIGANTAIFSLLEAALLRPPAGIARPSELLSFERRQAGQLLGNMGYPDFLDYARDLHSFSWLAAESTTSVGFNRGTIRTRIPARLVSGSYFPLLGVQPLIGRVLTAEDERRQAPVVVLSAEFWRHFLGADRRVLGSSIRLAGQQFTVVGVAPGDFNGTMPQARTFVWLPITTQPLAMPRLSPNTLGNRATGWLRIFGRLRPGVTPAEAQAEVSAIAARLGREYPLTNRGRSVTLEPGLGMFSDDRAELRRFLDLLLASVILLQLIACANVASLRLAQAATRTLETKIRLALGARRSRLLRMSIAQAAVLATLAGTLGVLAAPTLARLVAAADLVGAGLQGLEIPLDPTVLGFALLVTLVSIAMFTAATWAASSFRAPLASLHSLATTAAGRWRLRGGLIAVQIALSLALLATGATVFATLERAVALDPVPAPERVLLATLAPQDQGTSVEHGQLLLHTLLARLRALPGVSGATLASSLPPLGAGRRSVFLPNQEPAQAVLQGREFELGMRVSYNAVAPGFFALLGIPLLRGRDFSEEDRADSPRVAIVSWSLAHRLWPRQEALGMFLAVPAWSGPRLSPVRIVGIARDMAAPALLGESPVDLYLAFTQEASGRAELLVRSVAPPLRMANVVQREVETLDSDLLLFNQRSLVAHLEGVLWQQRIAAWLLAVFGLLAVALAAAGLYGVVAHAVIQRTREIGIRTAVGARPIQICALVLREGMIWVLIGMAAGAPLALLASMVAQRSLSGVRSLEVWTLGPVVLLLMGAGLLASVIPARRAATMDVTTALRLE